MERLGKIVCLAGRNGSGKTRLLKLISSVVERMPSPEQVKEIGEDNARNESTIAGLKLRIQNLEIQKRSLSGQGLNVTENEKEINSRQSNVQQIEQRILAQKARLAPLSFIDLGPAGKTAQIVEIVPKALEFVDPYTLSQERKITHAKYVTQVGNGYYSNSTLSAIQNIQDRYFNAERLAREGSILDAEYDEHVDAYRRLQESISKFLGASLNADIDGNATLFGKRIGEQHLSDGQIILLQISVALYAQKARLSDVIIFMDEPENHLHPAALVEMLDAVADNLTNGQLWIATHSLNTLAHFPDSSIWHVDNGVVSYAGNVPEKVLGGLLGDENEIHKLSSFLSLPAQFASERFAFQCLLPPAVAQTGRDDPQTTQIAAVLRSEERKVPLRVLDYGVGKARLLAAIAENDRHQSGRDTKSLVDFYGFDDRADDKEVAESIFDNVYGRDRTRYFNSEASALVDLEEATFDYIVMCNVLHEIDPLKWLEVFIGKHSLMRLLRTSGHLLVVEDQLLAVGEKAHAKGFLVLDALELKRLFAIKAEGIQSFPHPDRAHLKAHKIAAGAIPGITASTRCAALQSLATTAKTQISALRTASINYRNGRLHSFWAQQLANSTMALEELGC